MSSRKSEFASNFEKPAQMYLEWSSEEKCFKYYNRDTKENELIPLPLKFLVLKEMHTVKGWHDKSQSGIYSNEVKNIGTEPLEVKSFKGGTLAKGIYKDIKEIIGNVGGKYNKSIYAMREDGTVINISFKGAAVQEWGDAFNKAKSRMADEFIVVGSADDRQKGKVKYSVPVFKFEGSLSDAQSKLADAAYDKLEASMNNRVAETATIKATDDFDLTDEDVDF